MADNTLTLTLDGEVSLADFAAAMRNFDELIAALSSTMAAGVDIQWVVDDLEAGSATVHAAPISDNLEAVKTVVYHYNLVGQQLAAGERLQYPPQITRSAEELSRLINGGVSSVILQTALDTHIVTESSAREKPIKTTAQGAVKGWVQTLSARGKLSFTVYDAIFDKPVRCYLERGQEDLVSDKWGKKVIVSGQVTRNQQGHAISMRKIRAVDVLPTVEQGSYKATRGILSFDSTAEAPETIIRRLRDATNLLG